jgi:siderophore synthetase component
MRRLVAPESISLDDLELQVWRWALDAGFREPKLQRLLKDVRLKSVGRFLECLFRERLVDTQPKDITDVSPTDPKHDLGRLSLHDQEPGNLRLQIPPSGELLLRVEQEFELGRFTLREFPTLTDSTGVHRLMRPVDLVATLQNSNLSAAGGDWETLTADFTRSNALEFLSELLVSRRSSKPHANMAPLDHDRRLVDAEQQTSRGHRLHPTPKSISQLSVDDIIRFGPNGDGEFALALAAIPRRDALVIAVQPSSNVHAWLSRPQLSIALKILDRLGLKDHCIVPVHPLQLRLLLAPSGALTCDGGSITLLTENGPRVRPLISFRTVFVPETGVYLKLPLHVAITSARRTLSIRPRHNSIELARILDLIAHENSLPPNFGFQREVLSVGFPEGQPYYKDFGFIMREPCSGLAARFEVVLSAASLLEPSRSGSNGLVLDEQLGRFLVRHPLDDLYTFFELYVAAVVPPCLTLLARYGIGLEAHLQNTIIGFSGGKPVGAIYRDNDAVSVCLARLNRHASLAPAFYPASWNVEYGHFPAEDKVRHSLFHAHLAEIANHLCREHEAVESRLWSIIGMAIHSTLDGILKIDDCAAEAIEEDRNFFFSALTDLKSLTRMKLMGVKNEYIYTVTRNPLSSYGRHSCVSK